MDSITATLARFVIDTRSADIPDGVLTGARNALIDTIGVALAGTGEPVAGIARRWVLDSGATARASIWGCNEGGSAADAAFANGVASHALDFDDSHPSLRGHPSATMIPAALAVG